jgi:6-phosphogluconolactonase
MGDTPVPFTRREWMASTCLLAGIAMPRPVRRMQSDRRLFVGTYTGTSSRGIYTCLFNEATGELDAPSLAADTPNPSFLASSADGRFLFAVNEIDTFDGARSGSVTSFAIDAVSGRLTRLSVQASLGAAPCHLALDGTGRFLAVANYTGGTFALLPVGADGRLAPAQAVLRNAGTGPNRARQGGPHAHMVLFDATNRYLLGADLGIDRVLVYRFDPASGAVAADPSAFEVPPGSGPRHLAFHPRDPLLFAINELTSTVSTFIWDDVTGWLDRRGEESTLPDGYSEPSSAAEIAVHPSGRFLYGSNRGHDSITCWGLSSDGQLALIDHVPTRGRTPRHFALAPSGRWLLAANQASDSLVVFAIDEESGRLTPTGPLVPASTPVCLAFT